MGEVRRVASALARSCHPAPTCAVTAFGALLAVTAGTGPARACLMAAAVLFGQLSIGWSNDRFDAERDRTVNRLDKPIARGEISLRSVDAAIATALVATVALSLSLGWRAGLLHLAAVGCGWLYNFWLKRTWWSWLPYAAAFGALPGVATFASPGHPAPAGWVVAAGALLGVTAHLTNALPDLAGDAATQVRGLPHRLGPRRSLVLATVLLLASSILIVFGPPGATRPIGWVGLVLDVLFATLGLAYA
ncbi:MAG TPA: UbiA family prenyltransferase, partial [Jatrophihabitans sp.]|nr:UbiA family prenyltransferase [Jatrophihabitans sp.]